MFAERKEGPLLRFFSLKDTPLWLGRAEQLGFDVEGFSEYGGGGAGCDALGGRN